MFTGAKQWQIKHTFGKKVSLGGVCFVIIQRTLIVIFSGKSVAEREPSVSSYEATTQWLQIQRQQRGGNS